MTRKVKHILRRTKIRAVVAVNWIRGSIMIVGLSSVTFADHLAGLVSDPPAAQKIRIGGVILSGLSVILRAGQRNQSIDEIQSGLAARGAIPQPQHEPSLHDDTR